MISNTGTASDYAGPTVLQTSANPAINNHGFGVIQFGASNQIPDNSAVTATTSGLDANGLPGLIDLNGKSDTIGSLAGNMSIMGFGGGSTLTVGGNNTSTTYSGVLGADGIHTKAYSGEGNYSNVGNNGILNKIGSGTFTLGGANLYTGATNIGNPAGAPGAGPGGTLLVTGSLANTSITVGANGNTGALGGNGSIAGPVTVTSTGQLAPAISPGTTSTLTISNDLTISSGGTLNYNFGATGGTGGTAGTSDLVNITGTGNLNLPDALTLDITALPGFGMGLYKLLDATGTSGLLSGTDAIFTVHGSNLFNYAVVSGDGVHTFDKSVEGGTGGVLVPAKTVYLEVLQGNPFLYWTGSTNGNWNTTSPNWTSASSGNQFSNGANVTFDDGQGSGVAPSVTAIARSGWRRLSRIASLIGNNVGNYTFGGGAISALRWLSNKGARGQRHVQRLSRHRPPPRSPSGTFTIGSGTTYSSSTSVAVTGGALLAVNGALHSPSLSVADGSSATVGAGGSLQSGMTVQANGALTLNNPTQFLTALNGGSTGSVALNGTALTLLGSGSFSGAITGTGGKLTINAPGEIVTLAGASAYTGGTNLTSGTLVVANITGSATGTGLVDVGSNGTLTGTGLITGPTTVSNLRPLVARRLYV